MKITPIFVYLRSQAVTMDDDKQSADLKQKEAKEAEEEKEEKKAAPKRRGASKPAAPGALSCVCALKNPYV